MNYSFNMGGVFINNFESENFYCHYLSDYGLDYFLLFIDNDESVKTLITFKESTLKKNNNGEDQALFSYVNLWHILKISEPFSPESRSNGKNPITTAKRMENILKEHPNLGLFCTHFTKKDVFQAESLIADCLNRLENLDFLTDGLKKKAVLTPVLYARKFTNWELVLNDEFFLATIGMEKYSDILTMLKKHPDKKRLSELFKIKLLTLPMLSSKTVQEQISLLKRISQNSDYYRDLYENHVKSWIDSDAFLSGSLSGHSRSILEEFDDEQLTKNGARKLFTAPFTSIVKDKLLRLPMYYQIPTTMSEDRRERLKAADSVVSALKKRNPNPIKRFNTFINISKEGFDKMMDEQERQTSVFPFNGHSPLDDAVIYGRIDRVFIERYRQMLLYVFYCLVEDDLKGFRKTVRISFEALSYASPKYGFLNENISVLETLLKRKDYLTLGARATQIIEAIFRVLLTDNVIEGEGSLYLDDLILLAQEKAEGMSRWVFTTNELKTIRFILLDNNNPEYNYRNSLNHWSFGGYQYNYEAAMFSLLVMLSISISLTRFYHNPIYNSPQ